MLIKEGWVDLVKVLFIPIFMLFLFSQPVYADGCCIFQYENNYEWVAYGTFEDYGDCISIPVSELPSDSYSLIASISIQTACCQNIYQGYLDDYTSDQLIRIGGSVTNINDGTPIGQATIEISTPSPLTYITNNEGAFLFPQCIIPNSDYTITVSDDDGTET